MSIDENVQQRLSNVADSIDELIELFCLRDRELLLRVAALEKRVGPPARTVTGEESVTCEALDRLDEMRKEDKAPPAETEGT